MAKAPVAKFGVSSTAFVQQIRAGGVARFLVCVGLGLVLARCAAAQHEGVEYFEKHIRPVLRRDCLACHHQGMASGSLALDSRGGWQRGGDSGPAIVAGDPDASLLIRAIRHQSEGLEMPSKAPRLADDIIREFESWVRMGAPDPRDQPEPVADRSTAPWDEVASERAKWWCWKRPRTDDRAGDGPQAIDHWIDRGIHAAGITPSVVADRRTLIRRLSFQLGGLPPTYEEVEAFVSDSSQDAWKKCVDRFLETPDFGVHWARHWLDVVRYAETHGSEDDAILPFSYRYRDYAIRAFQNDLPFDQFLREHLAGDLIAPRWNRELGLNESLIGTAFLRFVEFNQTPVDVKREEIIVIDNQIDAIGKAFQGITISCARCHDHKFDPISDEDYYALYGILRSTRACQRVIDDPILFERDRAKLEEWQNQIRELIAPVWMEQTSLWPTELDEARRWCQAHWKPETKWDELKPHLPEASWTRALARAICQPKESPLGALAQLLVTDDSSWPGALRQFVQTTSDQRRKSQSLTEGVEILFDLNRTGLAGWRVVGVGLTDRPLSEPGAWAIEGARTSPFAGLLERGYHSNLISDRHGGSLRSPDFVLDQDEISLLARGFGNARARLVIENFQGDSLLFSSVNPTLDSKSLQWVTMPIRPQWRGLRAHLELLTRDDKPYLGVTKEPKILEQSDGRSSFGVAQVVKHPRGARPVDAPILPPGLVAPQETSESQDQLSRQAFMDSLGTATRASLDRFRQGTASDEDVRWLTVLMDSQVLRFESATDPRVAQTIELYRQAEGKIPVARRSPGVHEDACAVNQAWLPRGDHRHPKEEIPRRYLAILGSDAKAYAGPTSGRLQLAQEITSAENPLTARVYVNRVWHWMFGRGLVTSVDNFGRMGEPPSHPELLDHLAVEFMREGWSTKQLIRNIALSNAWQRSSIPSESARQLDPANRWWSHASVRRLDAESVRDTMLLVAGNLKRRDEGLGTLVYYRSVLEPNKQSPPGPLDGDGRRSIFLEVRRNFPNEFLLTFDFPRPTAPAGRRPLATVPGQSLTLMNDPFVVHQSQVWAKRVLQEAPTKEARLTRMYRDLLSRDPAPAELEWAMTILDTKGENGQELTAWTLLAHALLNVKEAIYLP